jgi:hypothetical protein
MSNSPLNAPAGAGAGPKLGRAAGFGYATIFVTGMAWYGVMQAFRAGGDAALLAHIREGRLLFEVSILAGAATFAAYLVTAVLLYRRFSPEAGIAASLLFTFVVASVPLSLAAVVRQMELLSLLDAAGVAAQDQQAQAVLILRDFDAVGRLSSLFWGLWLLPLAWLAFRSGGVGRLAGAFLALGGLGYMSAFVRPLLAPGEALGPVDIALGAATVLSELAVTLWLLLAADRHSKTPASP